MAQKADVQDLTASPDKPWCEQLKILLPNLPAEINSKPLETYIHERMEQVVTDHWPPYIGCGRFSSDDDEHEGCLVDWFENFMRSISRDEALEPLGGLRADIDWKMWSIMSIPFNKLWYQCEYTPAQQPPRSCNHAQPIKATATTGTSVRVEWLDAQVEAIPSMTGTIKVPADLASLEALVKLVVEEAGVLALYSEPALFGRGSNGVTCLGSTTRLISWLSRIAAESSTTAEPMLWIVDGTSLKANAQELVRRYTEALQRQIVQSHSPMPSSADSDGGRVDFHV